MRVIVVVAVTMRLFQHLNLFFQARLYWQDRNCRLWLKALPQRNIQLLLQLANTVVDDWLLCIRIIRQISMQLFKKVIRLGILALAT